MNFAYRAISNGGSQDNGVVEAASQQEALRKLVAGGRTVFALSETEAGPAAASLPKRFSLTSGNRKVNAALLFSDLAMLTGAGLTVTQSLQTMRASAANKAQQAAAELIAAEMAAGRSAADAFARLETVPDDALAMIASGENAGSLPQVFAGLASRMEEQAKTRTTILNALAYPAFLIVLMCLALGVVTFVLVPSLEPVFANSGKPPPFAIGVFTWLRGFLINGAPFAALAAAVVAIALLIPARRRSLGMQLQPAMLRMPFVGSMIRSEGVSRYLSSLSMMLENGAPMAQSLSMAAQSAAFPALRQRLIKVRDEVSAGRRLPQALQDTGLFDGRTLSLIGVGYDAGRLPQVAAKAAQLINATSRERLSRSVALLTPVLTIFMGLVIGGLVVSVMTALLAINELAIQ